MPERVSTVNGQPDVMVAKVRAATQVGIPVGGAVGVLAAAGLHWLLPDAQPAVQGAALELLLEHGPDLLGALMGAATAAWIAWRTPPGPGEDTKVVGSTT